MPPAARVGDMHTCPLVTGVVPHVGGPVLPPGCPTVLIGSMPAARVGDMLVCVGPPDAIAMGSPTVLIGNMMAARLGDPTVHGGVIVVGLPTVLIGIPGAGGAGGPITEDRANQLFKELAAQKQIPFDYPDDCCYSRAHEMCRIMNEEGIECRKVWNYAHDFPNGAGLRADTPNNPSGHVNWRYHVAPVVSVIGNDGIERDMVMDPSLFDRPVTVDEWQQRQQDTNSTIEITEDKYYFREPGNTNVVEDPDYSATEAKLKEHVNSRDLRNATGP